MRILIAGGAGFIGSHFIRHLLVNFPDYKIVNLDKLTYAGNLGNLRDVEEHPNYRFVQGDICDVQLVESLVSQVDVIINFAAETHVDRSLLNALPFVQTDVTGTLTLLEASRRHPLKRYIQISTDEVYGPVPDGEVSESAPLLPSSPYAASKAAADLLVMAYRHTYQLPISIIRLTNNFGPNQYPEKFIPLFITNAIEDIPLPLYGDGWQEREWIFVEDGCAAIAHVIQFGNEGEVYNVGTGVRLRNIDVARSILRELGKEESLIHFVQDRRGHDRRYALDSKKILNLKFKMQFSFPQVLQKTIQWYRTHTDWWKPLKMGKFREYYQVQYPNEA